MARLDDLRREYERELIGPAIHAEIRSLAGQVASAYSPSIYAGSPEWTADALDDLVQDLAADWLLAQGQLAYALGAARTLRDFRAITVHTIRRALAARRIRSVIDNLLPRCEALLAEEGYEVVRVGNRRVYRMTGAGEVRDPTDEELRAAELMVHTIPRLPGRGGDRASAVYTASNLRAVLSGIACSIPRGFSLGDLDRILRRVLTAWVPGILVTGQELPPTPSEALSPEDVVIVRDTARSLLESLSALHRKVLALYLASVSDAEAAIILGVKARQTVLRRRAEIAAIISHHLEDLESRLSNAVLDQLAIALATHGRDSSGP
jgi:hypothetical protein